MRVRRAGPGGLAGPGMARRLTDSGFAGISQPKLTRKLQVSTDDHHHDGPATPGTAVIQVTPRVMVTGTHTQCPLQARHRPGLDHPSPAPARASAGGVISPAPAAVPRIPARLAHGGVTVRRFSYRAAGRPGPFNVCIQLEAWADSEARRPAVRARRRRDQLGSFMIGPGWQSVILTVST